MNFAIFMAKKKLQIGVDFSDLYSITHEIIVFFSYILFSDFINLTEQQGIFLTVSINC